MGQIKYSGEVDETGKLTIYQRQTFKLDVKIKFHGKPVWVIIEDRSSKMSKSQRGYLMGVVLPRMQQALRREQGFIFTPGETRVWVETNFLSETREMSGQLKNVTRSISDLSKLETTQLIEDLIVFSAETLGEVIPYPNEATAR